MSPDSLLWLGEDRAWFLILHGFIVGLFLRAFWKDLTRNKMFKIGRSENSRKTFLGFFGAASGVVLSVIFQISEFPKDGKVFLYVFDIGILSYLCFYNSWFTNKIVTLKVQFEQRGWQ